MRQLYLTLFCFLLCLQAFAQKDFRPGYILQKGDTLHGYVDYRGEARNAKVATFKATPASAEQVYSPADIAGYGFREENKMFVSRNVPATAAHPEQVLFMNVLIQGKVSIYSYRDSSFKDFYYLSKGDGELVELVQKEYTRVNPATGKNHRVVEQLYLGTLAAAFYDCDEPGEARIKNAKLSAPSLVAITTRYNQCVAPEGTTFQQEEKKPRVTVGAVAGYTHASLRFSGSYYLSESSFTQSLPISAGLSFNIAAPNISEKLTLQIDALLVAARFSGEAEEGPHYGRSTFYQTEFDMMYLKFPVQVRYTYPQGRIRPFVNAGLMGGYALKDTNETKKESYMGGISYIDSSPAVPPTHFRPLLQGLTAGTGILYPMQGSSLSLEARYELNNGLSYSESMVSSINTFYLLLGYNF